MARGARNTALRAAAPIAVLLVQAMPSYRFGDWRILHAQSILSISQRERTAKAVSA
jgi:hypothetical protein